MSNLHGTIKAQGKKTVGLTSNDWVEAHISTKHLAIEASLNQHGFGEARVFDHDTGKVFGWMKVDGEKVTFTPY
jgi:hypothetical protein